MKHMVRGAVVVAVTVAGAACSSDPSADMRGQAPTHVQVNPAPEFLNAGDSEQVRVRLINDANYAVLFDRPTLVNNNPGIFEVRVDTTYRPDYRNGDSLSVPTQQIQHLLYVKGITPGTGTYTVTAGGLTTTATVTVEASPANSFTQSAVTGIKAGDTLTFTLPGTLRFTPGTAVTFATGPAGVIVNKPTDSSSTQTLKVVVGPGSGGLPTITGIYNTAAPTLAVKTLTATSIANVPAVTTAPTTVSNAAPAAGAPITVALGGGLRYTAAAKITIGGVQAGIISVSADSSTATVIPMLFSSGAVAYTGIVLGSVPSVQFASTGDKSVTVGAAFGGATDANALTPAAPTTIALTGTRSLTVADNGPFTTNCGIAALGAASRCRYYKITVPAGNISGDIRWSSAGNLDLGVYLLNAAGTACVAGIADNLSGTSGTTGDTGTTPFNCSTGAAQAIAAGTYLLAVVDFSATDPAFYEFRISQP